MLRHPWWMFLAGVCLGIVVSIVVALWLAFGSGPEPVAQETEL